MDRVRRIKKKKQMETPEAWKKRFEDNMSVLFERRREDEQRLETGKPLQELIEERLNWYRCRALDDLDKAVWDDYEYHTEKCMKGYKTVRDVMFGIEMVRKAQEGEECDECSCSFCNPPAIEEPLKQKQVAFLTAYFGRLEQVSIDNEAEAVLLRMDFEEELEKGSQSYQNDLIQVASDPGIVVECENMYMDSAPRFCEDENRNSSLFSRAENFTHGMRKYFHQGVAVDSSTTDKKTHVLALEGVALAKYVQIASAKRVYDEAGVPSRSSLRFTALQTLREAEAEPPEFVVKWRKNQEFRRLLFVEMKFLSSLQTQFSVMRGLRSAMRTGDAIKIRLWWASLRQALLFHVEVGEGYLQITPLPFEIGPMYKMRLLNRHGLDYDIYMDVLRESQRQSIEDVYQLNQDFLEW